MYSILKNYFIILNIKVYYIKKLKELLLIYNIKSKIYFFLYLIRNIIKIKFYNILVLILLII